MADRGSDQEDSVIPFGAFKIMNTSRNATLRTKEESICYNYLIVKPWSKAPYFLNIC